ncbi:hypothetical protein J416_01464 [Gracilibacillus halophilus YIM-C55.5]|uniref:Peptidyl-prolyl cis-trans isomerase n=1 Tax=Gracilibacillus halophilus YIM-C55.5 TaxID=1308866 RepID=N4WGH7_9BACI|nr:hypothetical protein [Gracilibacillus halophilus]ENH98364.1 hypothetical protein J416_01464 [Gracilibacillus halophilus YIM-C55.5]
MIIQIKGNVTYPITLDPTVWIFDDRKIKWEDAFSVGYESEVEEDEVTEHNNRIRPPVHNSVTKQNKKDVLNHSYVMPIIEFLGHAEVSNDAKEAILESDTTSTTITLDQLEQSLLLFAVDGSVVKDQGPAHLYFDDGSNREHPIKGIKKIHIQ